MQASFSTAVTSDFARRWGESMLGCLGVKVEKAVAVPADRFSHLRERLHDLRREQTLSVVAELIAFSEKAAGSANYGNPALRDRIKSRVMAGTDGGRAGQWSARKAQLVAQRYEAAMKKRGASPYRGGRSDAQKKLSKWTKEKWSASDGKPAKRKNGMTRYLPAAAWAALTPAQRKATNAKKKAGGGKQFVRNTSAAAAASKRARGEKAVDVTPGEAKRRAELGRKFDQLANMSGSSVLKYAKSDLGRKSGLSKKQASTAGAGGGAIASGRQRPAQIARLKGKPKSSWTPADWSVAGRVVSFISRMKGGAGPLYDDKQRPTRKLMSLLIWGHDPRRSEKSLEQGVTLDITMTSTPLVREKGVAAIESAYHQFGEHYSTFLRDGKVNLDQYDRVIKITPTVEKVDLQNQMTTLDALRDSWEYYCQSGNVDLEHLSKQGWAEGDAAQRIKDMGFTYNPNVGKMFWEIGRPIPGTFDPVDCSFLAYIYTDRKSDQSAANWYWSTVTARKPAMPWRPSIGGLTIAPVPTVQMIDADALGPKRIQYVEVLKRWKWNNTAMTAEPVMHSVPATHVIKNGQDAPPVN